MKLFYFLFVLYSTITFLNAQETAAGKDENHEDIPVGTPVGIPGLPNNTIYVLDDNGTLVQGEINPDPNIQFSMFRPVLGDIHFYLYTKIGKRPYELFVNDSINLSKSPFNSTNPTKILIHGFWNSGRSQFCQQVKDTYLNNGQYNVIVVDWGALAKPPFYYTASSNTRFVGDIVAQLVDNLVQKAGMNLDDLHIIGHSLGAHTAGIAGKHIKSGQLKRITGLDPAWPLYEDLRPQTAEWRLTKDDALFVDVIHTAGGVLGFLFPIGDNDYYPNGGINPQPGCLVDLGASCSHSRSWEYFMETIYTDAAFPTEVCENLEQIKDGKCKQNEIDVPSMGEKTFKDLKNRLFHTKTRTEKPFAFKLGA
ncbi:phospholipase A1 VesT1.02-like [Chrysoperla carnea]|uniref:phospholipase A1 VesT1.02-like n=1 Tax=Chrysoperla carnea TaxID=189513 RepID=UPI001D07747F|nr:phospholipase A1 VesT1.02-like [Chrysoperla carnea]